MMKTERLERFLFMIKQDVRLTSGDGGCGGGSEPIKWTESVREAAPGKTGPRTADTNYLAVRQDSQARVFSIPAERVLKAARGIASITDQRSPVPTTLPITNVGGGEVTRCVTIEPGCRHAGWPRLHVSFFQQLVFGLVSLFILCDVTCPTHRMLPVWFHHSPIPFSATLFEFWIDEVVL